MIDTGRPASSVITAMQKENVYIGRIWPVWPNAVRISVGSPADMAKFRTAFKKVMDAPPVMASADEVEPIARRIAGTGGKAFLS
jgi:histidinol-phosphate aminotransferase